MNKIRELIRRGQLAYSAYRFYFWTAAVLGGSGGVAVDRLYLWVF